MSSEEMQSQKAVVTSTQVLAGIQRKVGTQSALASQLLASTGGQNRFLALSIKDQRVFVTGWKDENERDVPILQREFVSESLSSFSDCTFKILKRNRNNYYIADSVAEGNIKTFPTAMRELLDMSGNGESGTYFEPKFSIPYASVGKAIIEIARKLEEEYHRSRKVHGDIKPHNILFTTNGPQLIDDLSLKVGDISPAVSPGWGAFEQLSVQQSVQCATDIYPIGVMFVSLLKGQVTGEIVNHAIPSSRGTPRMVTFIRDPLVYLDPRTEIVPKSGMSDWLNFMERCLHLNPTLRFATGGECARELEKLLAKYPLQGRIEFSLQNRGEIERARFSDNSKGLCRVVLDLPYS
jgi:serine/threonine protein kinase